MKKKGIIITVVIVAVVLMLFVWVKNSYNGMVSRQEAVAAQWAQVENAYQRRADLIPNLVATVKGYAEHEQSTLREVIEARSKATSINVDPTDLEADDIARFQAAQDQLSGALSRLLVSIERYPDLKANQNFLELQSQLEGTENRITVERQKFNNAAQGYNQYIRQFPRNIISSMFDFEKTGYFKAASGSEVAPKVEF